MDSKPGTIFRFFFINENEAFKFSDEQPFGITDDVGYNVASRIPGTAKLMFSKFLINTASPIDIFITVYENGTLSTSKTIRNVRFYKNKRTILTGKIYSPATAFNVNLNEEFDKDSVEVSF